MSNQTRETVERLRSDMASGRTGDKVLASDPAMAPLGTDKEAAGTRYGRISDAMNFSPVQSRSRPEALHDSRVPRVVVVGAGFGGLEAAKALARSPVEVVVIDENNHHCFQPLLYQVATAALSPADIAWPIRSILRRQRNARVMLARGWPPAKMSAGA